MTWDAECVVLGAGVVGLACARALALAGREVWLIESEGHIGAGISSRNSEVIHAGLYYPANSLKAQLCVEGRDLLYAYCNAMNIPHRRLGKLIVAQNSQQVATLKALYQQGTRNGARLEMLSAADARRLEPALRCSQALLSPSTGIIDSHALMLALQADGQRAGVQYVFRSPFRAGRVCQAGGFELDFGSDATTRLRCQTVINATGLSAVALARGFAGMPLDWLPPTHFCKGSYFALQGRSPFRHLIYPVPDAAGLGVHLTLDLQGQARFGPDTEWVEQTEFAVDPARARDFYAAIRTYWPGLPDDSLAPAYAGVRPKLVGPEQPAADFWLAGPETHHIPGLIHLLGIESPGLTASLALARRVVARLG